MDISSARRYIDNTLSSRINSVSGASVGYISIDYRGSYFFVDVGVNISSRSYYASAQRQISSICSDIKRAVYPHDVRFDVGYVVDD